MGMACPITWLDTYGSWKHPLEDVEAAIRNANLEDITP